MSWQDASSPNMKVGGICKNSWLLWGKFSTDTVDHEPQDMLILTPAGYVEAQVRPALVIGRVSHSHNHLIVVYQE